MSKTKTRPSLATNFANTYGLARQLVWLWQKRTEQLKISQRTKAFTVAAARFDGACQVAHAVGYGITVEEISRIVRHTIEVEAGTNEEYWYTTDVINAVAERLNEVGWDGSTV